METIVNNIVSHECYLRDFLHLFLGSLSFRMFETFALQLVDQCVSVTCNLGFSNGSKILTCDLTPLIHAGKAVKKVYIAD